MVTGCISTWLRFHTETRAIIFAWHGTSGLQNKIFAKGFGCTEKFDKVFCLPGSKCWYDVRRLMDGASREMRCIDHSLANHNLNGYRVAGTVQVHDLRRRWWICRCRRFSDIDSFPLPRPRTNAITKQFTLRQADAQTI
jgi:hypothetical protein